MNDFKYLWTLFTICLCSIFILLQLDKIEKQNKEIINRITKIENNKQ